MNDSVDMNLIEKTTYRQWYAVDKFGEKVFPGSTSTRNMSRMDAFLLMYPPAQLSLKLELTNDNLRKSHNPPSTAGEMMKF